jgi:hypothetical protein
VLDCSARERTPVCAVDFNLSFFVHCVGLSNRTAGVYRDA